MAGLILTLDASTPRCVIAVGRVDVDAGTAELLGGEAVSDRPNQASARLVPRIVGRGLTATGVVYLVGSFTVLLAPGAAATLDPMYGIAVLAELALAGWLAFRGVDTSTARRAPRVPAAA